MRASDMALQIMVAGEGAGAVDPGTGWQAGGGSSLVARPAARCRSPEPWISGMVRGTGCARQSLGEGEEMT